jgi:hypothetical protein
MKKRVLKQAGLFLTSLILASSNAFAATTNQKFTDVLRNMGSFLFEDVPRMGYFGFKFLLWIVLFSLFDYGLRKASMEKKVAGIIAFAVSLGTVILIPGSTIISLFSLYAFFIIVAFGVIVPLIYAWVIYKNFNKRNAMHVLIRAAAFGALGVALIWFASNADLILTTGLGVK